MDSDVRRPCGLQLRHLRPEAIHDAVGDRLPLVRALALAPPRREIVRLGYPTLRPPRDHVMPEIDMVGLKALDVLHRRIHLTPVWLVHLRLAALPLGGSLLAFLLWFLFVLISIYTTYALPTESTYGLKTKRKALMPEHRDF